MDFSCSLKHIRLHISEQLKTTDKGLIFLFVATQVFIVVLGCCINIKSKHLFGYSNWWQTCFQKLLFFPSPNLLPRISSRRAPLPVLQFHLDWAEWKLDVTLSATWSKLVPQQCAGSGWFTFKIPGFKLKMWQLFACIAKYGPCSTCKRLTFTWTYFIPAAMLQLCCRH